MSKMFSNNEIQQQRTTDEIAKDLINRIFAANEDIDNAENQICFRYDPKHRCIYISKGVGEEYSSCLCIIDMPKDIEELLHTLDKWKAEALAKEIEASYDELAAEETRNADAGTSTLNKYSPTDE